MCDENEEEYQDIDDIQETNENSNLIVFHEIGLLLLS